jgi:thiol:disulfide interchange protein
MKTLTKAVLPLIVLLIPMFAGSQGKPDEDIYPAPEKAPAQLKAALADAARLHKRIILDFGGNWCGDCRVLDKYFRQEPNATLLKQHFILVDVNIGKFDKNQDIAKKYGVPLEKGVPALAVLDSDGHPLFSQRQGEFESMRRMDASAVTDFLKHWKG